jgi:hypothetical protein
MLPLADGVEVVVVRVDQVGGVALADLRGEAGHEVFVDFVQHGFPWRPSG